MTRRILALLAAALAIAFAPAAPAQDRPPVRELFPPIVTDDPGKIEVVEFFWYECPHCYALEPYLEAWLKKLPADVVFKRVPATFNQQWMISARVYYALESLGDLERLHRPLLDAIHKDGLRITNEAALSDWLKRQGVDVEKFRAALKSFAVESKLRRAHELVQGSKIDGVPAMMVNGRYVVAAQRGLSEAQMLELVSALIERTRKQLSSSASKK